MKRMLVCALAFPLLAAAAHAQYGTGADGSLNIASSATWNEPYGVTQSALVSPGGTSVTALFLTGTPPANGTELLVYATASGSPNVGMWETAVIASSTLVGTPSPSSYQINFASPLANAYAVGTFLQKVPHYTDVTIGPSGSLSGQIVFFRASGTVDIQGAIDTDGRGYLGGDSGGSNPEQGSSPTGTGGNSSLANGGGGGAGEDATIPPGGGGGGHATAGSDGQSTISSGLPTDQGIGGGAYGSADLSAGLFAGAGGGTGGEGTLGNRAGGGNGGGIVWIAAAALSITGTVSADGAAGEDGAGSVIDTVGGGGGGGGGTVWLQTCALSGNGLVSALGGFGGLAGTGSTTTGFGGDGGDGRIRLDTPGASAGSLATAAGSVHLATSTCPSAVVDWSMY